MDAGYYIKFIFSSLCIIGVLLVILKYSKKIQTTHLNKHIKIKDRIALGSQSNLFIIEIKEKEYVIGSTSQSIHLIDKL